MVLPPFFFEIKLMDDMSSCQLSVISVLSRNNKKRRKEEQDTRAFSLFGPNFPFHCICFRFERKPDEMKEKEE
jgi:hypothetical protein